MVGDATERDEFAILATTSQPSNAIARENLASLGKLRSLHQLATATRDRMRPREQIGSGRGCSLTAAALSSTPELDATGRRHLTHHRSTSAAAQLARSG